MSTTIDPKDLLARVAARGRPDVARRLAQLAPGRAPLPIHAGPLEIAGPWSPATTALVVDGPVTIAGALITAAEDGDGGLLVLLGPVRCTSLLAAAGSTTLCAGALDVDELLFAATRDVVFEQHGPLRAGAIVSGAGTGWLTSYHDEVVAAALHDHVADGRTGRGHAAARALPRRNLAEVMVPEVVDLAEWEAFSDDERAAERADGNGPLTYAGFDERAVHARFFAGQPLLQPGWRATLAG
ncbi:MAG: hypothetical protein H6709_01745 [Kofleriaceae bacterium]|nr:hypothetical protein [Kofleriaceae bacterium]